ncbi:MAG: MopE-related protein [Myxococcota bacterium]|nr:MopE-related protein [Myxococcota bacterium]
MRLESDVESSDIFTMKNGLKNTQTLRFIALIAVFGCGSSTENDAVETPLSPDAMVTDALVDMMPLAPLEATCTALEEVCNGEDDDCDGEVDEAKDVVNLVFDDLDNCGVCGRSCRRPNAITTCRENKCVFTACEPNFLDENRDASNFDIESDGCETKANCIRTSGGRELCDESDNDCDGKVDEDTNFSSDPNNCGGCNVDCPTISNGVMTCEEGSCQLEACDDGWVDLNNNLTDGCEYSCFARSTETVDEFCNGLDDDCDGKADENVAPPDLGCGVTGACGPECTAERDCASSTDECTAGGTCAPNNANALELSCEVDGDCQDVHRGLACIESPVRDGNEWVFEQRCVPRSSQAMCDGRSGYRCVRSPDWQAETAVERCDGIDNDCDGRIDESFRDALFQADGITRQTCELGLGVCRTVGSITCDESGQGTRCTAMPVTAETDRDDTCDGIDNDCDGQIDEDFDDEYIDLGSALIYAYEASRPGATDTLAGLDPTPDDGFTNYIEARSCSRPGVQPWSDVTWQEAKEACEASGARLCTASEWSLACSTNNDNQRYPYGRAFQSSFCNGGPFDPDSSTPEDEDYAVTTGSLDQCQRDGVFDLSGNLKEWIEDGEDNLKQVRGGSFETDLRTALTCQNETDLKDEQFHHISIGFRCCRTP